MDINNAREEKVSLELAIGELIEQFEDRTGTTVSNIHVRSRSTAQNLKLRRLKTWVEIEDPDSINDETAVQVAEATA